jgi:autotransporter family porin
VQRSAFEPRPQNAVANESVPTAKQIAHLAPWSTNIGDSSRADSFRKQITGKFTGTTDEILQWVACKWGIEPDIVRAQAVVESSWQQNTQGDPTTNQSFCPPHTWNGKSCYQSYGILQIKYYFFQSTWPMSLTDTAFNAEYAYGLIRACYEGWTTYLNGDIPQPGYERYHAGDIWGCLGSWFSGHWYDPGAIEYIQDIQGVMDYKDWLQPDF